MRSPRAICYLGMYASVFSRNKIYINGLRARGVEVIECRDDTKGVLKYWQLWKKHRAIRHSYDVLVIGYLEHILVPFAQLISSEPVIVDMLGSLADAESHSHEPSMWRTWKNRLIDWLAVTFADVILLESGAQKKFFIERFGDRKKFMVLYTGVDESVLYCSPESARGNIVLFRGRFTPESGIFHILEAAKLLKSRPDTMFRVIGTHYRLAERVRDTIKNDDLTNVELINEYLPDEVLREKMCEAKVALGQFESNPRLDRTIPHKAFEAMYMGLPLITGRSPAVEELLVDGESCLFVERADPADLARKITTIIDNPELGMKLANGARAAYDQKCSNEIIVTRLLAILSEHL